MKISLSRETVLKISWAIDNCLPPIVRDRFPFGYLLMRTVFKKEWRLFYEFKDLVYEPSLDRGRAYYAAIYDRYGKYVLQGETDLNAVCVRRIMHELVGSSFVDVGCGRGYLANLIGKSGKGFMFGMDIVEPAGEKYFQFWKGSIEGERQPLHTDTVICTHTLEHVMDIFLAVRALREMARERLIIVLPRQRAYNYHANPHLWFFPYRWNVLQVMRPEKKYVLEDLGGDWFYMEDMR